MVPIALKHAVGKGFVITVLLEDASVLEEYGILEHILARLAKDVLPFELVDSHGTNMLEMLEMLLARTSKGWQVTVVNHHGVTKQPAAAAKVDPSKRLRTIIRLKPEYGTAIGVKLLTAGGVVLGIKNNSVEVTVDAGDLVVVHVQLASAVALLSPQRARSISGNYTRHAVTNCYTGHGGINIDSTGNATNKAVQECEAFCDGTPACSCVVHASASSGRTTTLVSVFS